MDDLALLCPRRLYSKVILFCMDKSLHISSFFSSYYWVENSGCFWSEILGYERDQGSSAQFSKQFYQ